jgi:predicted DNA-binding transcriptional regulator AlpA
MSDKSNTPSTPDEWISVRTLAERLQVSEVQVRRLVERQLLPEPARFGRKCVRWSWPQVVQWMKERA